MKTYAVHIVKEISVLVSANSYDEAAQLVQDANTETGDLSEMWMQAEPEVAGVELVIIQ